MTVARALPADAVLGAVLDMSLPCLVDAHPPTGTGVHQQKSVPAHRINPCAPRRMLFEHDQEGAVAQVAQSADYGAGKGPWAGLPSLRPRCRATALVSMRSEFVVPSDRSGRLVDQRFG